jgi:hypothetical protein
LLTLQGHTDDVTAVAWNSNGSLLASGSFDQTIRIWDVASGQSVGLLEGHGGVYHFAGLESNQREISQRQLRWHGVYLGTFASRLAVFHAGWSPCVVALPKPSDHQAS